MCNLVDNTHGKEKKMIITHVGTCLVNSSVQVCSWMNAKNAVDRDIQFWELVWIKSDKRYSAVQGNLWGGNKKGGGSGI